jgi:hypothetical protein
VQVEEVEVEMVNPLHDQARSWLLAIYFRLAVPRSMTRASEADVRVCAGKAGAQGDYDDDRRSINNRERSSKRVEDDIRASYIIISDPYDFVPS